MLAGIFLPVAVTADLRARLDFEEARDSGAEACESPRPEAARDGHQVRVTKRRERSKIFHEAQW